MELDLINTVLKTIAMLFIVLGFLILVLYLVKKFILPKGKVKGDMLIKVLSTLYLSSKERVEVIEISGEKIVVGVTPGSISFLTKLSDIKPDHRAGDGS
ncbi:MAG: flagellar biosynthetic protein FliO [Deltaproteobacteria bacterium]|nr:flagellar biosynthetic protein FliO [Deltaproteobacteria bacterium]MBW1856191.1 flagellar biosynthetic protein FliO [Deltaproteobacteria bacterium]